MPHSLCDEHSDLLKEILDLQFDAVLTTNYSYELEVTLKNDFKINRSLRCRKSTKKGNRPQEQLGIFKYITVDDSQIWHIHGEAARPNSMVMGHYYYGKLLCEIQKRVPEVIRKYRKAQKCREAYHPKSWIDYFLIGNVHIIGFGLNPSEMDIWWLINCKKRHFLNCGKVYLYEPNMDESNKYALKALTEIFWIHCFSRQIKENDYIQFYKEAIVEMKKILESNNLTLSC